MILGYVIAVTVNDSGVVFAGTAAGTIYKSSDNGLSWTYIDSSSNIGQVSCLIALSNGNLLAGSNVIGVNYSTDGGKTWNQKNFGITNPVVTALFQSADGSLYAGTQNDGLYKSTDLGSIWDSIGLRTPFTKITSIVKSLTGTLFVSVWGKQSLLNGGLFYSTNEGSSWNKSSIAANFQAYTSVVNNLKEEVYASVFNDGVFISTDDGKSWQAQNNGLGYLGIQTLGISKDGCILAGTDDVGIYRSIKSTTSVKENNKIPSSFVLYQNYPNPFNPSTTINFSVPKTSFVTIKVYDVLGKEVATLVNAEKSAGNYSVQFPAKGGSASSVYFYRMQAGSFIQTKKLLLLK